MKNKQTPENWKVKELLEEMNEFETRKLFHAIMRGIAEYEANMTKWDKFTSRFFWRYYYRIQGRVRKAFRHRRG